MTFETSPARPFSALAAVLLMAAPLPLLAQDLSQMPQQSVLDTPGSRTARPVTRSTTPPAPTPTYTGAPLPMVSNPVVQPLPTVSRPVVQAVPSGGDGQGLNAALARLAQDPRNPEALLDAGNAAMALGDVDAALGFLRRAADVAPGNGRVNAQLGKALLRHNEPLPAIRAFDEAERSGADLAGMAGDRGLAHDLVGDNAMAQRYYQQALARAPDAEITRRLALSLAIGGDRASAEKVLAPQIAQSDRAAWRVRTFILAIAGQPDEAVAVANSSMPPQLAAGIAPYLRYLTRLTPAQQAAAANFGRFPRAADIGRDDPQIVQYAQSHPRQAPVLVAQAQPATLPATAPVRRDRRGRVIPAPATATASASTTPGTATAGVARPTQLAQATPPSPPAASGAYAGPIVDVIPRPASPPAAQPATASTAPATATPAPAIVLPPVPQAPAAVPASAAGVPPHPTPVQVAQAAPVPAPTPSSTPSYTLPPQAAPQPAPQAVPPAPSPDGFAALFAGFAAPAEEQQRPTVAVDLAAIQAANERAAAEKAAVEARQAAQAKKLADAKKAAADKKAAAEKKLADAKKAEEARKAKEEAKRLAANPARTWVQVLTGGNRAKMGKEWAGLQAKAPELHGRKAYVTSWNRVYRLVTGPFPSDAAAQEFVAKLKAKGVGAFQFDSPAGQAMDGVSAK